MKEFWIKINESTPKKTKDNLLNQASQICDVILVNALDAETVRPAGVKIASSSGNCDIEVLNVFDEGKIVDLKNKGKTIAVRILVKSKEDEARAIKAATLSSDYIILDCPDWKVIPLENLIARTRGRTKLLAEVSCAQDAQLALEALELGADGIVLTSSEVDELIKTALVTKKPALKLELVPVKIVEIKLIGTGARVCVDTCDLLKPGEGILVGCQSSGFFLVEAEVHESPYIEPRPFRVNAGPSFLYVLSSANKTRYLSELKAGSEILLTDRVGNLRIAYVGRIKIEWRPLILVEAECKGKRIKVIVQNAETIRFVSKDSSKSVAELKIGDEVLAHITEGGRHFGTLVKEETVIER